MNKMLAVCAAGVALACGPLSASELVIGKDEHYVVTAENMNMALDRLVIADNAKITFADGVDHWELLAKDATVGFGVVIDGSGDDGADGADGASHEEAADACRSGKSGNSGEAGANGEPGVDIYLGLDASKIGNLKVVTDGGAGGAGGTGGAGQDAGRMFNCPAARGGSGGHGGPGGDGGRAGNVVVSVNALDSDVDDAALTAGVSVSVKPGKAGRGGEGGPGGSGSEGDYVRAKTLTGSQKWVAGGPSGHYGSTGEDGEEGAYGQVFVGGKFTGFLPVSTHADGYDGFDKYRSTVDPAYIREKEQAEEEIRVLKEQLRQLKDRMDALENE